MPAPTSGREGSDASRAYSEPHAQASAAPSASSAPTRSIDPPLGPTSSATPPSPTTSPTMPLQASRRPLSTRSNTAIQSGIVATSSAATPESMRSSESATPPFPPRSNAPPTIAAASQWRPVGPSPARSPRRTENQYRTAPATRNRAADMSSGGIVSIATMIPRYVEPQTT